MVRPPLRRRSSKSPVDQVIKVGTKPSEANEKVTWTAEIPFKVVTRPNPELKPGEIRVVQKGVPGEKTYTADFTAKATRQRSPLRRSRPRIQSTRSSSTARQLRTPLW
ncbi:G5 domain-containing protein [Corynebacterium jeikeium]|uniref:G5 domain-containing protein n=1 Tax=Corynebacterium jeikeium TaxID=38289 RepID=UPI0011C07591